MFAVPIFSFSPGAIPDACIWFLNLDEARPEIVNRKLQKSKQLNVGINTHPLLANIAAELGLSLIASVKRAMAASHSP